MIINVALVPEPGPGIIYSDYALVFRKELSKRQQKYEAKSNLDKNRLINSCTLKNQEFRPPPARQQKN